MEIPIFPLRTVLFPNGYLPLRIFEQRYLDMIKTCLKDDMPFGVCAIRQGSEVGATPEIYRTGTSAKIVDWEQLKDGLLGVTAEGGQKFEVHEIFVEKSLLMRARVEYLVPEQRFPVMPEYDHLVNFLRKVEETMRGQIPQYKVDYSNAVDLSYRLAEILPVPSVQKQSLLEVVHPLERLDHINKLMGNMDFAMMA